MASVTSSVPSPAGASRCSDSMSLWAETTVVPLYSDRTGSRVVRSLQSNRPRTPSRTLVRRAPSAAPHPQRQLPRAGLHSRRRGTGRRGGGGDRQRAAAGRPRSRAHAPGRLWRLRNRPAADRRLRPRAPAGRHRRRGRPGHDPSGPRIALAGAAPQPAGGRAGDTEQVRPAEAPERGGCRESCVSARLDPRRPRPHRRPDSVPLRRQAALSGRRPWGDPCRRPRVVRGRLRTPGRPAHQPGRGGRVRRHCGADPGGGLHPRRRGVVGGADQRWPSPRPRPLRQARPPGGAVL